MSVFVLFAPFHVHLHIYYWHKVKHIPFMNFTWDFGTLRIKSYETFKTFVINFDKNNIVTSNIMRKRKSMHKLTKGCNCTKKITHKILKIQ